MAAGFSNAYGQLREAQDKCDQAEQQSDAALADAYLKSAYRAMYSSARTAQMLFETAFSGALGGDEVGLGAQGGSFSWAKDQLEGFTRVLLGQYCMQDGFPSGDVQACRKWLSEVKSYVDALAAESGHTAGVQAAEDRWEAGAGMRGQAVEGTDGRILYDPRDFV